MTEMGYKISLLTGDMTVEERSAAIAEFVESRTRVLISTNVTARGSTQRMHLLSAHRRHPRRH